MLARAEAEEHLRDYLRVVLTRKWFLIAFFCLVVGGAAAHVYSQTPIYEASALILVEPQQINVANVQDLYDPTGEGGGGQRDYYQTQCALLSSRRIAEPVHRELGLERTLSLRSLMGSIQVAPVKNTRLVRVGFWSPDPDQAIRVANALVDSYLRDNRQRSLGINSAGLVQLREQAKELAAKVEEAHQAIERFKEEHQYLVLDEPQGSHAARLQALSAGLAGAQGRRLEAEAEERALALTGVRPFDSSPQADAGQRLIELEAERRAAALRLGPNHPILAGLDARLTAMRQGSEGSSGAGAEALRNLARSKLEAARGLEEALRHQVEEQIRLLSEANRSSSRYGLLVQAHETVVGTYKAVIERIQEIDLASSTGTQEANVFMIDRAEAPASLVSPNVRLTMIVAVLLGLLGGVGLCFLVHYLDRSIKDHEEAERILQLPVLGHVPSAENAEDGGMLHRSASRNTAMSESFRSVRTGVTFGVWTGDGSVPRRLLVTSAIPRDGKTLVSVNLATTLAQMGRQVLLIDGDLRNPCVASRFGLQPANGDEVGLSTLLTAEDWRAGLQAAIQPVESVPGLSVLPSGPRPPNPADLLNSERMGDLVRACQERFDWLVVDSPPAAVADPMILSTQVNNVLLVVRSYTTPRDLAARASQELAALGARVVGVVLNDVDLPPAAYGYGYYGYRYSYGYGYGRDGRGSQAGGDGRGSQAGGDDSRGAQPGDGRPSPAARS